MSHDLKPSAVQEKALIARSPVADAKSIKNETEIDGFRQCHIRDGAALVGSSNPPECDRRY
jgi:Xaa-Pro aminopeptidase